MSLTIYCVQFSFYHIFKYKYTSLEKKNCRTIHNVRNIICSGYMFSEHNGK